MNMYLNVHLCFQAHTFLDEVMESLMSDKNRAAILAVCSAFERVIISVPEPANMKTIARRRDIQRSGLAVKSIPIQRALKMLLYKFACLIFCL